MKKLILILIIALSIMSNLYSKDNQILDSSITSGWVSKGNYFEQSLKIDEIVNIRLNSSQDTIYTICKDGSIRKWKLEDGKLIKKFNKNYPNADINPDKEEICVNKDTNDYNIRIIDLNKDSIIFKNKMSDVTIGNVGSLAIEAIGFKYSFDFNKIISFYKQNIGYYEFGFDNDPRHYLSFNIGVIEKYDKTLRFVKNYENKSQMISIDNSLQSDEIIYSSQKRMVNHGLYINNYNIFVDSIENKKSILDYNGNVIINVIYELKFAPNSNLFFGYNWNGNPFDASDNSVKFIIWDKNTLKPIHDFNGIYHDDYFIYKLYNTHFTSDSKKLIHFVKGFNNIDSKMKYSFLQIRNLQGDILKDSIFVKDNYVNNVICRIEGTNKFLIGGSDGILRLLEEELMNKGLVAFFKKDSVTYFAKQAIQFRDFSEGNVVSRFWDFGDLTTSTEQNPLHTYKKSGDYTVKLIVYDGNQYDTLIKKNYIQLRVKANFETKNTNVVAPFKVDFVNTSKGENTIFKWYFGDGDSSNAPVPSHNYTKAGFYDIKLIVSDGIYSDTLIKKEYIKVVLPLQAGFEVSNNIGITPFKVDFKNVSTGEIESNKWYFGDGDSSTKSNLSHTYTKGGNYTVSLVVSDGVASSTYTKEKFISVSDNLSVEGGPAKEEIPPFSPNPVKDKLFIKISEFINTDKVQILDMNGRKILETDLKETIDVSSLAKGIYILKIENKEWKFVKE